MQWLHYGATIFPLIRLDPSLVRLFEFFFPFRARPFGRRSPVTTIEKVRATLWSVRCVLAVTPNDGLVDGAPATPGPSCARSRGRGTGGTG